MNNATKFASLALFFAPLLPEGQAASEGAILRLRPILMTGATTFLGFIPLLFATGIGSEVQRPLAAVVVGGLFTATASTLFLLPALYRSFMPGQRPAA